MPLLRYFGFAGSALVLLLFGLNWFVAPPVAEPIRSGIDRSVIRISSVEKLPERVDIDSSLPTIVPAPKAGIALDGRRLYPVRLLMVIVVAALIGSILVLLLR